MKKKGYNRGRQHFEVLNGQGRRFSFSRLKQAFLYYVLLLLALVIIVQVGYHWLGEQFLAWRLQVVAAERGIVEQEKEVAGLVTRSEQVVNAPASGVILDLAEPGERVSVGENLVTLGVVSVSGQGDNEEADPAQAELDDFETFITVKAHHAGLLSYYTDGWEKHSDSFYLSEEEYVENRQEGSTTKKNMRVAEGEPILKIVHNWHWYYNVILPLHPGRTIAEQQQAAIKFAFAPDQLVQAELFEAYIDKEDKEVRLTYLIKKQISGFEEVRWTQASLIYNRQEGIIVPAEAVFKKEGKTGVYLNRNGRVVFQPVTVISQQGDRVMVEGLAPQNMVITRHELVEEGRRLN